MAKLPDLNPIMAPSAICSACGNAMEMVVDRGPRGRAVGVFYRCKNETSGCDYQVYSDIRLTGQAVPTPKDAVKEKVAD